MTVNYCGTCGSANGKTAVFCRHCGAELSVKDARTALPKAQASSKTVMPEPKQTPKAKPRPAAGKARPSASEPIRNTRDAPPPEPVNRPVETAPAQPPAAPPLPNKLAQPVLKMPPKTERKPSLPAPNGQRKPSAGIVTASSAPMAATAPTKIKPRVVAQANTRPVAPNHHSTAANALAQASGLAKPSRFGLLQRGGAVLLLVIVCAVAMNYLLNREQSGGTSTLTGVVRNLVSSEGQSAQYVLQGDTARTQGQWEAAIENYQRALELAPNQIQTQLVLAQTYASAKQIDEALRTYETLLRQDGNQLSARLQVAEIQRARGNWSEAQQQYLRIINIDQNSEEAQTAFNVLESAAAAATPEAVNAPQAAQRRTFIPQKKLGPVLPPSPAAPRSQLALTPRNIPGLRSAAPVGLPKISEEPDPKELAERHKDTGMRLYNIRQYRAAINELGKAQQLTPWDKDIYYFLGGSYKGLGEAATAHAYYKRCDGGTYKDTARSGAEQTKKAAEKALREEQKRRQQIMGTTKVEAVKQPDATKSPATNKSLQNSFQKQQ